MSKQTAVEWFIKELKYKFSISFDFDTKDLEDFNMTIQQAKEMEKQQLISFGYTQIQYIDTDLGDLIYKKTPEEIYNDTYKGGENV